MRTSVASEADRGGPIPPGGSDADRWRALVEQAASEYESWGRVDDMNRWAPWLCSIQPGKGRISAGADESAHAGKLYYLFARDRAAYVERPRELVPGQVIVKESWAPRAVEPGARPDVHGRIDGHLAAQRDGRGWIPGERAGLFVMAFVGADEPRTDQGWIYATTSADGRTVREAGVVERCAACHAGAPNGRLFGLRE